MQQQQVNINRPGKIARPHQGQENLLAWAVKGRDAKTLKMVPEAVQYKNVMLAYRPIVQTKNPDKVVFYEAFILVLDETKQVIPSREFITVIEETELGRDIDCLALKKGLQAMVQVPNLRLAINMPARSIGYRPWMQILNRF